MLIDTHCHLCDEPLFADLDGVRSRALLSGVTALIVPSVTMADWTAMKTLDGLPGVFTSFGIHPWKAEEGVVESLLEEALGHAVAVGEVGLDWKVPVPRSVQLDCLEKQLRIARKLSLPVLLHCRGAFDELRELLQASPPPGAIIHGFSRSPEQMFLLLELGCCIGFGGAVTRGGARNARASAAAVPEDRFVLETDSPWLGIEGGPSEPSSLRLVASAMAAIRGVPFETVALASSKNAGRILLPGL